MKSCPFCASENIFYSKKRSTYVCEDCDKTFAEPAEEGSFRVFISYGHDKNLPVVKMIKSYLSAQGYDVWIDSSEITPGKDWRERITSGLLGSNGVVSFLSKHSVRNPGVCLDELRIAFRIKRAYLKSILLEDKDEICPPPVISNIQWIDMSDWRSVPEEHWDAYFEEKMSDLLAALRSEDATEYSREIDTLSQKLKIVSSYAREQFLLSQVFVGREWLTDRVYQWINTPGKPSFMIYGVPGAGKSAFAANLIQYDWNVAGYIIFEWDHAEYRNADWVIRRLAFELAANLNDYRKMLLNLLCDEKTKDVVLQMHGAALFDQLILNPIQCCIDGGRGPVLILFDGLDETAQDVAELLLQKADRFPEWVRLLFTSRYDESFNSYFDPSCIISLDGTQEQNMSDIREYVAYCLNLDRDDPAVERVARKSEGSFQYAAAFCDALEAGNMSLADETFLPRGIENFYRVLFKRTFPTGKSFLQVKPLLELLATGDDIPEQVACVTLEKTIHELWEIRYLLKSIVVKTETEDRNKIKILKFVHKSIHDWITDQDMAGEFFVDEKDGYRLLVKYAGEIGIYEKQTMLPFEILQGSDNATTSDGDNGAVWRNYANQYLNWIMKSGELGTAKRILLNSFDEEQMRKAHDGRENCEYYKFLDLWRWADNFPQGYPVSDLVEKMEQIALFPCKYYFMGSYAHRSIQIISMIFYFLMDSGRYASAFYAFMRRMNYAWYFCSAASDDNDTRDGWDKYYMTMYVCGCIKKLQKKKMEIPFDVLEASEEMKLTYNFYWGRSNAGMFKNAWSIHKEPIFFKDICKIQSDAVKWTSADVAIRLQAEYNTDSLRFYLACSDEEDLEFIHTCVAHHADPALACERAIQDMKDNTWLSYANLKRKERRVEFIEKVRNAG